MTKINSIYRGYYNGMYSDTYRVTYESGRQVWFDLRKIGEMPISHFEFIINAKCIPIYANKYTGTHEGQHLADKFVNS